MTKEELEAQKTQRENEVKALEKEYNDFEIKSPADVSKKFELFKTLSEKRGINEVKNFEEKCQVYEDEIKALKEKKDAFTAEEATEVKSKLESLIGGFDALQIRIKNDSRRKDVPTETKSFGDALKEVVDENQDEINKFLRKEIKSMQLEVKAVADVSTANVTGGSVWGAIYKPGIITNPNQINHIRTALPIIPAGPGTDYYFMKENGNGEGAPSTVAEKQAAAATDAATGLKPQFDVDLIESSVKFETIAGILIASKKAMNNIPGFMSYLNMRVPEKLLDVEDEQILYGDGNTPNLKGLLVSGNYTASTSTATVIAERIIDDISLLEDTYKRIATAIWMRPAVWWAFFKNKADGATGVYDLPQNYVFVGNQLYIGGVPAYKTTALHTDDYFVEALGGAELVIQEGVRMEFFNQHASLAATNQIMIRVEETIALPVYGATYRILGDAGQS